MHRASAALLAIPAAALLLAACIPARDNENDPAKAPAVTIRVLADGLPVSSAERRAEGLVIEVRVSDPQKEPATVVLTLSDPRTEEEAASLGCTRFEPVALGSVVTSSTSTIAWTTFPPSPCFAGDPVSRFTQPVLISALATDPGGNRGSAETAPTLVNARPIGNAGPALWVDPSFTTTARLDARRSVDPDAAFDPPGSLTYEWRQISGPATLALQPLGSFDVDLGPVFGTIYTVEMTVCDPWECADPVQLDVHKRPAMWMVAQDGVALLDAGWAEARKFHEPLVGNAAVDLPVASEVFGGRSAAWIVSQGNAFARSLGSDFILRRVAFPTGYQAENTAIAGGARAVVLGGVPGRDVVWVRVHQSASPSVYAIAEISRPDPIGPAQTTLLPGLGATTPAFLTVAAQRDAASPLWLAGRNFSTDAYTIVSPDGTASAPSFTFDLPAPCAGEAGNNIASMDVAFDGSLYLLINHGLVHLDPEAQSVLGCTLIETDSFEPTEAEWVELAGGDGEVLVGYRDDEVFRVYNGSVQRGPNAVVLDHGIAVDTLRNRVVTASPFGMESWIPGDYGTPISFVAVQEAFTGAYQLGAFGLDYLGRPWAITSYYFSDPVESRAIRVSPSLSLFRAHHRAEALGISLDDDRLVSVDRASGRIWVARPRGVSGEYEAAPFDEFGPVPNLAPVPLPGVPIELVHDAGTANRPGGFWVSTNAAGGLAVHRVDLAGNLVTSFGDGASLPPVMLTTTPTRQALDPATGALWGTLDEAASTNDGVFRFALDGTFVRVNSQVVTHPLNGGEPSGAVDAAGDYWFANAFASSTQANLVRTRAAGTQQTSTLTAPCTSGSYTPARTVAFDASAGQIVTLCSTGIEGVRIAVRHSFTPSAITLVGSTVTGAPPSPGFADGAVVSPVDGTVWHPQAASIVLLDRYGNFVSQRALPVQVSVPIRH